MLGALPIFFFTNVGILCAAYSPKDMVLHPHKAMYPRLLNSL